MDSFFSNTKTTAPIASGNALENAAILLISLESHMPGITNTIFGQIGEERSKQLLKTIASIGKVDGEAVNLAFEEFHAIAIERNVIFGGEDVSEKILKETFGISEKTSFFAEKENFFKFLVHVNDKTLLDFIENENDQMAAVIFHYLEDERLSDLISKMDLEKVRQITQLVMDIEIPSPALIWELQIKLETLLLSGKTSADIGEDSQILRMSRILELVNPDIREAILQVLEKGNKNVLEKLKALIFTFNNLDQISDKDIETLLYEVSNLRTLAIALKGCEDTIKTKILSNLSTRVKIMLDEEISTLPQTVSPEDIELSQREILKLARRLEKEGRIARLSIIQGL